MKPVFSPHRPSFSPRRTAFTLIELLTVIAVIGILAAILLPVIGSVRKTADNARCVSMTRQWGSAILAYTNDNRSLLPGPCYTNVRRDRLQPGQKHLFGYLLPYLGVNSDPRPELLPSALVCPGWMKQAVNPTTAAVCVLTSKPLIGGKTNIQAWGYPGQGGQPDDLPVRLTAIDNPSTSVALTEYDGKYFTSGSADAPPLPVHGNHRNQLFFDGHVARAAVVLP